MEIKITEAMTVLMDLNNNPLDYIYQNNGKWETTDELDTACAVVIDVLGMLKEYLGGRDNEKI